MEKTITISLYNRPDYTKEVLNHLLVCNKVHEYQIDIFCEPGQPVVEDICKEFKNKHNGTQIHINENRLGCNKNIYQCLNYGFGILNSDFHIHLEDDIVPSKDCLEYFEWTDQNYANDKSVMTVCSYNRYRKPKPKNHLSNEIQLNELPNYHNAVAKDAWFTPWGWATWKNRWDNLINEYLYDSIYINNTPYNSWDKYIYDCTQKNNMNEVYPVIARTQNIGSNYGSHVPSSQWHKDNQYNEYWIETIQKYSNAFQEINFT